MGGLAYFLGTFLAALTSPTTLGVGILGGAIGHKVGWAPFPIGVLIASVVEFGIKPRVRANLGLDSGFDMAAFLIYVLAGALVAFLVGAFVRWYKAKVMT